VELGNVALELCALLGVDQEMVGALVEYDGDRVPVVSRLTHPSRGESHRG